MYLIERGTCWGVRLQDLSFVPMKFEMQISEQIFQAGSWICDSGELRKNLGILSLEVIGI